MNTYKIWKTLEHKPAGKWLFSTMLALKAPYFLSIKPRYQILEPNRCELTLKKRWKVTNHLNTVHAIAMCNMAEAAGGLMTEAAVPFKSHRWIPKGMTVKYLKKAKTDLKAIATPLKAMDLVESSAYPVNVDVFDTNGERVFNAIIEMWVSPKS
ncbi:hotdog fold domain-containing protein [Paraferrimonas sp. SM1919]|uniref:hotdog fold domain-containing protein n=1 Tax=Paraferrimonas sp. SM1919 TaxID=2662263 RepID=UPI0013D83808|nr:hotdog fold domain-containing protein [Paraferrimonas sp. SM1919]